LKLGKEDEARRNTRRTLTLINATPAPVILPAMANNTPRGQNPKVYPIMVSENANPKKGGWEDMTGSPDQIPGTGRRG
jgi:hypothetical protein